MLLASTQKTQDLCRSLRITEEQLHYVLTHPGYVQFTIPKKSGGTRLISAPGIQLKTIQYRLARKLNKMYARVHPTSVYGFIPKQTLEAEFTIKGNAQQHTGQRVVLNIDLKDFFHSITLQQVYELFRSDLFQLSDTAAKVLALLCCEQKKLPMGAPTSPVVSNFICLKLDAKLQNLSKAEGLIYTRYADDLTFSHSTDITPEQIGGIRKIIHEFGFTINEKKVHRQHQNGKQWVTGLKVNEQVNVDRKYIRNLRAIIYDISLHKGKIAACKYYRLPVESEVSQEVEIKFFRAVRGKIEYVGFVKGIDNPVFIKLRSDFNKVSRFVGFM